MKKLALCLIFSALSGPAIFNTWWYIFSSTPPYQWFQANGFPAMNFSIAWITTPIGLASLGVILWSIRKQNIAARDESGSAKISKAAVADALREGREYVVRTAREREAPRPKPELQARIISVGIRGITGGTGITVYMEIDNLGTPSRADGFVASIKSGDTTYDLFPAELPPDSTFSDEIGEIQHITRDDTLYDILRNPIAEGGHALGFLFYFAKDVSAAQLTAKNPPEIIIRFRDVRDREYVVTSKGQKPSYPPNVRDPFVALPRREAAASTTTKNPLEVAFDNSDCLPRP